MSKYIKLTDYFNKLCHFSVLSLTCSNVKLDQLILLYWASTSAKNGEQLDMLQVSVLILPYLFTMHVCAYNFERT